MAREKLKIIFLPVTIDIKYWDVATEDLFICNKTDTPLTCVRKEGNKELQDEGTLKCPSLNLQ